jgi:hypothetical protein
MAWGPNPFGSTNLIQFLLALPETWRFSTTRLGFDDSGGGIAGQLCAKRRPRSFSK